VTAPQLLVSEAHSQAKDYQLAQMRQHMQEVAAFASRLAASLPAGPVPSDCAARLFGAVAVYASHGGPET
jgi:hypothetical protein